MELWARGQEYESYVGRWSRLIAADFLTWLDARTVDRWADVGCGTGALTQAILQTARPAGIVGIDLSEGFVRHARAHVADPQARFAVGTATALPLGDGTVGAAVSGLALNFVPDPALAVAELVRVTRPGGAVAAYVWDYADGMRIIRHFWDAAGELDPAARDLDEGTRFPLCRPEPLRKLFAAAGLAGVEVRAVEVPTRLRDFDDYWSPFLGGQGPAPGYTASLSDGQRAALRERLRARLPYDGDGSIPLTARAWSVRGWRA